MFGNKDFSCMANPISPVTCKRPDIAIVIQHTKPPKINHDLVATVWMGHDDFSSLGRGELAARTALPIWIDFMRRALDGVPEQPLPVPPGITTASIDLSGHLVSDQTPGAIREYFKTEDLLKLSAAEAVRKADQQAEQQRLDLF